MHCLLSQKSNESIYGFADNAPIIRKHISVALFTIFLICALIVTAVGVTGYLRPEALNISKMHSITIIVGGSILFFFLVSTLLFLNTPHKEEIEEEPEIPLPKKPNPLTPEEWGRTLNLEYTWAAGTNELNLIDPSKASAPKAFGGCRALPAFGNYPYKFCGAAFIYPNLSVRLPPSQLEGFPLPIQNLFKNRPNVELFFLIYSDDDDTTLPRNLVLHRMALSNPQKLTTQGIKCQAKVGLFDSKGIVALQGKNALPLDTGLREFTLHIHKTLASDFGISPNNCAFRIQPGVSTYSFYTAAQFAGRSVAFYTLLIRNSFSKEAALLSEACNKSSLAESIAVLSQEGSPCAEDVTKLFAYYP